MKQYIELGKRILNEGTLRQDRTGVGTLSVFDAHMTFDLRERFPLVTVKETRWKTAFLEMLWFLRGEDHTDYLHEHNCKLWDAWADHNGNLGPVYGFNWRKWGAKPDNIKQPPAKLRGGIEPTFCGVASGVGANGDPLLGTWMGMIQRCYDKKSKGYANYGAKGVHVCNEWLEFTKFSEDVKLLPGYVSKLNSFEKYELDKDIIGNGFLYSPYTCCWVTRKQNIEARNEWKYTLAKGADFYTFTNASDFAKEHNISHQNLDDLWLKGGNIERYGFRFVKKEKIVKETDQLKDLISNLKSDPASRRLLVTAWNVAELHRMALPPCHYGFQCYTSDCYLDLKFFMRSSDFSLGLPFNIAAYAFLAHLIARATGLKPRKLIVDLGDCHVYTNHVEQMKEVLERPMIEDDLENPTTLEILTENTDIDGYKPSDFNIVNYKYHSFVKLPVAV